MSEPAPSLARAVAAQRDWMTDLLLRLLREPTTPGDEEAGQRLVAGVLDELGLAVRSVPLDADVLRAHPLAAPFDWPVDGKRVVTGEWAPAPGAPAGGRSLLLSAHVDVPAPQSPELWARPPFEPYVTGGRIVGWGILKSGLVAMLGALRAMRDCGVAPAATLRLHSTVEEELSGNATLAGALALPPLDGALVAACMGPAVPYAQVGAMWFTVRVAVPPGHAADGGAGSAIDLALGLVPALERLAERLNARRSGAFAAYGDAIGFNVGAIHGGSLPSVSPGECEISCRIGLLPGERLEDRRAEVAQAVADAAREHELLRDHPPQVRFNGFACEGFELPQDAPIVQALAAAHAANGAEPRLAALTTALESRIFHHLGIPATCAGPAVQQLHAVDESVAIDDLVGSAQVIASFITGWCGVHGGGDA